MAKTTIRKVGPGQWAVHCGSLFVREEVDDLKRDAQAAGLSYHTDLEKGARPLNVIRACRCAVDVAVLKGHEVKLWIMAIAADNKAIIEATDNARAEHDKARKILRDFCNAAYTFSGGVIQLWETYVEYWNATIKSGCVPPHDDIATAIMAKCGIAADKPEYAVGVAHIVKYLDARKAYKVAQADERSTCARIEMELGYHSKLIDKE